MQTNANRTQPPASKALRPYTPPSIERVAITKTETGSSNPTEFMAIVGPTS